MAFDSLQVPATIINNDKLISMAGNLMAKQKAEKDAYSKSLIDQMAKIDSAGIRNKDVSAFNKMYNDYVSYGSANVNNLDNPEVQVKLKQMENQVRGFINVSKGAKETDVKVLPLTGPDFDDNTRKEAQEYTDKPTLERAESFDFTKSRKVDDKDYGAEALKMFSVDITSNIDGVELKNMDEGAIRKRVSNLMNSKANLPTVQKGVLQIGGGNAEKGVDMLQEMIVQETLAKQSQKIDDPSEAEKTKSYFSKYGYNENLIPALKFAADLTYALAKGDPKATKLLKNSAGEAIELIDNGKTIEISAKDNYGNNKKIQVFDRGSSMAELGRQVAGFLNVYGTKMGFKTIPLPEYDAFIKDPNYSKYGKAAMPIKGSTAEKEYNADPNYFNAFKTNVPVVKTATPKAAPIPAPIPQTVPNPNTTKPATSAQVKTPTLPKTKEPKNIGVGDSLLNGINFTPIDGGKKKSNEPKVVIQTPKIPTDDVRADGSKKGNGFLGVLQRPDGNVSTEISVGVEIDGKEVEIPTLIPTLTKEEINYLLTNDIKNPKSLFDTPIGKSILNKSKEFAKERIGRGVSPFYQEGEEKTPTTPPVNKTSSSNNDDLYNRVKEHEGVRNSVYKDSRGNLTIGVGFNLNRSDANKRLKSVGADPKLIRSGKGKLTDNQVDTLYKEDLNKAKISAKKLVSKTWDELPKGVQGVLTEMAFNLGEGGLSEFKNTLGYIEEKRFKLASQSMLKSKWARQIGDRAKTLANIIGNA
jgi:GH24 family phage-related lysozyme (muramidase)